MASRYPNGFKNGFNIRNVPMVQTHPGAVKWVYNGSVVAVSQKNGSDGNTGDFNAPYATLNYAITQCVANRGDIIFIKPGHTESIPDAATLSLSVAGIAVVGLGVGSQRPTFTFTTAATANIPVTAANVSLQNLRFVANFADVASMFTATGTATPTDFSIEGCEFKDTSNVLNALTVVTGNATANSMDGFRFVDNKVMVLGTTAATTAIKLSSATDRVEILDNFLKYAVLNNTATVLASGANNITNLQIGRNKIYRQNTDTATGGIIMTSSSTACSGMVFDNYIKHLDTAAAILVTTTTTLGFTNNLSSGEADASGFVLPAIANDS